MIDFSKKVLFNNGVVALNCTPHGIKFVDDGKEVLVEPCGATLKANACETEVSGAPVGAQFVKAVFEPSPEGLAELAEIETTAPAGVVVLASIISAQAYPGRAMGMVPTPETVRSAPADKRYRTDRFTTFG